MWASGRSTPWHPTSTRLRRIWDLPGEVSAIPRGVGMDALPTYGAGSPIARLLHYGYGSPLAHAASEGGSPRNGKLRQSAGVSDSGQKAPTSE